VSSQYTKVETPDSESGFGVCGHVDRAEAIRQARAHFQGQLDEARAFLDFTADELYVYQCTGLYLKKNIRELPPSTT
jgi:hypothetical protein